jgi:hypothetical protein
MKETLKKQKKTNPAAKKKFGGKQEGAGRPLLDIDPEMVYKLGESMLPVESIATILGCHKDTIYARFSDVLQQAREGRRKSLSMVMWEKALLDKDTKMMIWLSKQHLGYKDVQPEEATQIHFNVTCNELPIPGTKSTEDEE